MPSSYRQQGHVVSTVLRPERAAELHALAAANGRTVAAELRSIIEPHLDRARELELPSAA